MPDIPDLFSHSSPISISNVTSAGNDRIEITLNLSRAMAEQLTLLAAPLMRDLARSIERQKDIDHERLERLNIWKTESSRMFWITLNIHREGRKSKCPIDEIITARAMLHDVSPERLRGHYTYLHQRIQKRLHHLRSRAMCRLHIAKTPKGVIAKRFGVSVWVVNRTLDQWLPLITPQIQVEASHG
ncbi:MAG: hypothetical protein MRY32_02785 [Rickettsiales bacterium]|nr:hypothetical protein [Rickettsiales bacterium]